MKYFGYCTLLDVAEMAKYCAGAKAVEIGRLKGYRVCFSTYGPGSDAGGCNLEKVEGEEIYGLLYEMTEQEFEALDKIAGVEKGYYKRLEAAVTVEGSKEVKAFT